LPVVPTSDPIRARDEACAHADEQHAAVLRPLLVESGVALGITTTVSLALR